VDGGAGGGTADAAGAVDTGLGGAGALAALRAVPGAALRALAPIMLLATFPF
jgi:hypothetical protein